MPGLGKPGTGPGRGADHPDPALIVDVLESTPLASPYAMQKACTMLAGDFTPAFALKHALKDADLAAQAAQASGDLTAIYATP
jgi:3-hydroxyisobutyrate dehydrogenase